jgi:hypothetical protein
MALQAEHWLNPTEVPITAEHGECLLDAVDLMPDGSAPSVARGRRSPLGP